MGLRILLISIIIIILFIILHNFVGRVVFKNDIPTLFGYGFNSLESSTIDGEYKMGDLVLVKKQEDYNVGDYIIYTKNEKKLVELITDKTNNSYITVKSSIYQNKKQLSWTTEQVKVTAKNTLATNGKSNIEFANSVDSKYEYKQEEGKTR